MGRVLLKKNSVIVGVLKKIYIYISMGSGKHTFYYFMPIKKYVLLKNNNIFHIQLLFDYIYLFKWSLLINISYDLLFIVIFWKPLQANIYIYEIHFHFILHLVQPKSSYRTFSLREHFTISIISTLNKITISNYRIHFALLHVLLHCIYWFMSSLSICQIWVDADCWLSTADTDDDGDCTAVLPPNCFNVK